MIIINESNTARQSPTPEAVEPVLKVVRERHGLFPQAKLAILDGDYDHRFPSTVLKEIGDHLLEWAG